MDIQKLIRRFFVPSAFVSLFFFLKYRCFVSTKAEVEFHPNLRIGAKTQIGSFTKIKASEGTVHIGKNVQIAAGCDISTGPGGVSIGDASMIGSHVHIIGNNYRYDRLDIPMMYQGVTSKGISIGSDVWVGAGATLLDGTVIGNGVIITPNTVVSTKIPDNSIVQGNPGKVIFVRR